MLSDSRSVPEQHSILVEGVELAYFEWHASLRDHGATLLFAHATGFHARCWDPLIRRLGTRHAIAIDLRGHGRSAGTEIEDWAVFGRDLAALVRALELDVVLGVGHSMGGHALVDACARHPDPFVGLVLFDPVIAAPEAYARDAEAGAASGEEPHPTARRRNRFPSWQAMFERFEARRPYAVFDREALRAYCEFGLTPAPDDGEGLVLACAPVVEASIYESSRTNIRIHDQVRAVRVPVQVVRAVEPRGAREALDFSVSPTWPRLADAFVDGRDLHLPEYSHFLPMEDPDRMAAIVLEHEAACAGSGADRPAGVYPARAPDAKGVPPCRSRE